MCGPTAHTFFISAITITFCYVHFTNLLINSVLWAFFIFWYYNKLCLIKSSVLKKVVATGYFLLTARGTRLAVES